MMLVRHEPMDEETWQKIVFALRVLDVLRVSLHAIGIYEAFEGKDAAEKELSRFMGPEIYKMIAKASIQLVDVVTRYIDDVEDFLEKLGDEDKPLYWTPPRQPE